MSDFYQAGVISTLHRFPSGRVETADDAAINGLRFDRDAEGAEVEVLACAIDTAVRRMREGSGEATNQANQGDEKE